MPPLRGRDNSAVVEIDALRPQPAESGVLPAPTRGGVDRRVAAATAEIAAHLVEPGLLRVPSSARAAHLAARRTALPAAVPLVAVARTDDEAHRLADDLAAWLAAGSVRVLPERGAMPLERALPEHEESAARLQVLAWLGSRPRQAVVVAPLLALVQRTLSPAQLTAATITLNVGERIAQRTLLTALVEGGYEAAVEVSGIGEFASRGGIIDVWPPGTAEPVRVELFGDELESIRAFDPVTQGSRRRLDSIVLLPAGEFLPPGGWSSLARPRARTPLRSAQSRPGSPGAG